MKRSTKLQIDSASGVCMADLVLKNASIVNVFTEEIEQTNIAITEGIIVGLGDYRGKKEIDLSGLFVTPGFIDGHIHLESAMVSPKEFEKAVLIHGTTAVVADPHEIANVAGTEGIEYMLRETKGLLMDVFFMFPSCVPATKLDESGAQFGAEDLEHYYKNERFLGLAELMDFPGVIKANPEILKKIHGTQTYKKMIDGHGPGLHGKALNAYICAGVESDHECSTKEEALEKLKNGQWIMVREGTAAKNLSALIDLLEAPYHRRGMIVTDDKHPGDLIRHGHLNSILKEAVKQGADPVKAIIMCTYNPACYFQLDKTGAIAPGYRADLTVINDLKEFQVCQVYKAGKLVAQHGKLVAKSESQGGPCLERVHASFHMPTLVEEDLKLKGDGKHICVMELTSNELLTTKKIIPFIRGEGVAPGVDLQQDVIKVAVVERHKATGHVGIGFLGGYGLKKGAVASSIGHDSHNLIIAGTNDSDMVLAGNTVRESQGGLAIVVDGVVVKHLPLPIAGLMSEQSVQKVDERLEEMKEILRTLGIHETVDPFMTLAFISLPVIPEIRLNTRGVIDVSKQEVLDVFIKEK